MNKFALTAVLIAGIMIATPNIVCAKTSPASTGHVKKHSKHTAAKSSKKHKTKAHAGKKHSKHRTAKSGVKA